MLNLVANKPMRRVTSLVPHTMYAVTDAANFEYVLFCTPGSASTDSNAVTVIDSSSICYCSLNYAMDTFYLLGEAAMCNVNMEIKYA